jgi:ubiquitin fusion degradation protein 1
METNPGGEGISVLDTDLEVDFAVPKGYVEPERPKAAPPSTMASKLKIDLNSQTPGSSRPSSSHSGSGTFAGPSSRGTALSKGGDQWESFKGKGETLNGRKTKGKGVSHRKVEEVGADSKIIRTEYVYWIQLQQQYLCLSSKHRVVTNNSLESSTAAPAPLNLQFGKLFFGFKFVEYKPPSADELKSPGSPEVK